MAALPEPGAEHEQRTEQPDRDEDDDRADPAERRVQRRAEQRAEQTAGLEQRIERVAARAAVADVQQADDRRAHEGEAEAEAEVPAGLGCVAALDDDAARGDEQHERHDHPARAEHERRGRVEAVAERAGQVRVDPERGDEREDEQADGEGVVGVPAELAGQLLAPLRRGAPPAPVPASWPASAACVVVRDRVRALRRRLGAVAVLRRVAAIGGQP